MVLAAPRCCKHNRRNRLHNNTRSRIHRRRVDLHWSGHLFDSCVYAHRLETYTSNDGGIVTPKHPAEFASMAFEALELYWKIKKFDKTLADELYAAFCHEHKQLAICSDALIQFEHDLHNIKWFRVGDKRKHSRKIKEVVACVKFRKASSNRHFKALKIASEM